jgi:hypothetical protein
MHHFGLLARQFSSYLRTRLSVHKATAVIVTATLLSVIVGGF